MKPESKKSKASAAKKSPKASAASAPANLRAKSKQASGTQTRSKGAALPAAPAKPSTAAAAPPPVAPLRRHPKIPPLLLEGDLPPVRQSPPSGPGVRYALGPTPASEPAFPAADLGELPEGYGSQRLFLTARDPLWLYASWDLTREQRQQYNSLSADGHLIVRTYVHSVSGEPLVETHVHPESKSWFIHTGRAGTRFVAELGFRGRDGRWNTIATSAATITPPDRLADDVTVQFATLPPEVKFEQVVEAVRELISENVPLLEAVQQFRAEGHAALPEVSVSAPRSHPEWTPAETEALAQLVAIDRSRRVWMGSLEITELIRRQLQHEVASLGAAELARGERAAGPAGPGVSSPPGGGPAKPRGFWFNVNAELIIYGATERDAKVTIGGRAIRLRPDGTFSFRFALPDGDYELPVAATAADASETRSAHLAFRRTTAYQGEVKAHPQDASLRAPSPANAARA